MPVGYHAGFDPGLRKSGFAFNPPCRCKQLPIQLRHESPHQRRSILPELADERSRLYPLHVGWHREPDDQHQLFHGWNQHHGRIQRVGQGLRRGNGSAKNGLGEVYFFPGQLQSNAFPTDIQFAQSCAQMQPVNANQAWGWKGEWWAWGSEMIYSHTNLPNRYACQYQDQNNDGRATITAVNASSNHPGGVNVLFMDGSVRFIKSSVNYLPWYAVSSPDGGETISADSL